MYDNLLLYTLKIILLWNAGLLLIVLATIFIGFFIRKKINFNKLLINCMIIAVCILIEFSFLAIPRIVDINSQNYIVVDNATMSLTAMNDFDGSLFVFGIGKVTDENGKKTTVTGTELLELPTNSNAHQKLSGKITYSKYSHQILDFTENGEE